MSGLTTQSVLAFATNSVDQLHNGLGMTINPAPHYILLPGNTSAGGLIMNASSANSVMVDGAGVEFITDRTNTVTVEEALQMMNKSQFQLLTPSFILACILLLLGVPGNLIAILVYITKMKRSTAGYFIITLAFSDLTNCLASMPFELYLISHFWTFDVPWLCKLSRFLTMAMNNTSSFVLVAIAVERFRSICTPLKPRLTFKCTKLICISIIIGAMVSALPMFWGYGTTSYPITVYNTSVTGTTCLIADEVAGTSFPYVMLLYFFAGHITVFFVLAVLYICIARKLLMHKKFQKEEASRSQQHMLLQRQMSAYSVVSFTAKSSSIVKKGMLDIDPNTEVKGKLSRTPSSCSNIAINLTRKHGGQNFRTKRLTCMLLLVTSVFEVSFIPYFVVVSLRHQHPDLYENMSVTGKMAYQFFLRFYLINCAVNPIIYCFYNQNFRHGVKRLYTSIKELLRLEDSG